MKQISVSFLKIVQNALYSLNLDSWPVPLHPNLNFIEAEKNFNCPRFYSTGEVAKGGVKITVRA